MAAGNGVVVTSGTYEDFAAYDTGDGHRLWSRRLPNTRSNPTVVGDEVVFVTRHGDVEVLGLHDGRRVDHWGLPLPAPDGDWFVDVSTAAGRRCPGDHRRGRRRIADEALFAYPVGPEGRRGPQLHLVGRQVPGVPTEPPVLVGDDVVMSAIDGVYRVGPDGSATRLSTIEDRIQTGPAVSDGIVVAPNVDAMQGRRLRDGELLWESPSGDLSFGAVPAVDDSTVAYGIADEGLAVVDLHSGEPRWVQPIKNLYATTSPLLLPDGDVLYGAGGLARFDGETGQLKWRDPEAHLFGPPAFADGVVYGIGLSPTEGTGAMTAFDATTGERIWSQPATDPPSFLSVGSRGRRRRRLRRAHRARLRRATGAELWSLAMRRQAGGSPFIDHGRVFLTEFGSGHNVDDQDFRVSIHDLHTGRFLGAFEPVGMPYAPQPNVAGAPGGRLLVPTSLQLADPGGPMTSTAPGWLRRSSPRSLAARVRRILTVLLGPLWVRTFRDPVRDGHLRLDSLSPAGAAAGPVRAGPAGRSARFGAVLRHLARGNAATSSPGRTRCASSRSRRSPSPCSDSSSAGPSSAGAHSTPAPLVRVVVAAVFLATESGLAIGSVGGLGVGSWILEHGPRLIQVSYYVVAGGTGRLRPAAPAGPGRTRLVGRRHQRCCVSSCCSGSCVLFGAILWTHVEADRSGYPIADARLSRRVDDHDQRLPDPVGLRRRDHRHRLRARRLLQPHRAEPGAVATLAAGGPDRCAGRQAALPGGPRVGQLDGAAHLPARGFRPDRRVHRASGRAGRGGHPLRALGGLRTGQGACRLREQLRARDAVPALGLRRRRRRSTSSPSSRPMSAAASTTRCPTSGWATGASSSCPRSRSWRDWP